MHRADEAVPPGTRCGAPARLGTAGARGQRASADYGRGLRGLELVSIATFAALSASCLGRLLVATGPHFALVALVAVPSGWLLIDLLSGLAHWAFDSFGSARTPILGSALIRPFRAHHADPEAMTRHDFVETHGASCFAALPLLVLAALVPLGTRTEILAQAVLLFTALGALATNQCHRWAHMAEAMTPGPVRWAQRRWLVLPREHHQIHHTAPFDTNFCTAVGWLNAPLNALLRRWR